VSDVGVFRIKPLTGGADLTVEIPQAGANSIPVSGDFEGDGKDDAALVNPLANLSGGTAPDASVWIIRRSKFEGQANQTLRIPFGAAGILDRPSPADFDGDGRTYIAMFRASSDITPGAAQWFILPSGSRYLQSDNGHLAHPIGHRWIGSVLNHVRRHGTASGARSRSAPVPAQNNWKCVLTRMNGLRVLAWIQSEMTRLTRGGQMGLMQSSNAQ
jgi:hypothetical protein